MEIFFTIVAVILVFALNFNDKKGDKKKIGGEFGDLSDSSNRQFDEEEIEEKTFSYEDDNQEKAFSYEDELTPNFAPQAAVSEKSPENRYLAFKDRDFSQYEGDISTSLGSLGSLEEALEDKQDDKIDFDLKKAVLYTEILRPKY